MLKLKGTQFYTANLTKSLKTWGKKFKKAAQAGDKPVGDLFEGMMNNFDKTERYKFLLKRQIIFHLIIHFTLWQRL